MKISLGKVIEYLFYGIVFLLPWQAIWIWREPYVGGFKWEYGVIGLYGVDIFIVLFLVLSPVEYCRVCNFQFSILNFKSTFNDSIFKFKNFSQYFLLTTLYLILFWSFLSIFWSSDKILAFYFSLKLFMVIGLFWAVRRINFNWNKLILVLLVAGALQGALGVGQFLAQETFSSKWLGMSQHISSEGGTSVVENASGRWLRAYGSFPHPNILGGYLAIILLIIVWKDTRYKTQDANPKSQSLNPKQYQNQNDQNTKQKTFRKFGFRNSDLFGIWDLDIRIFIFVIYALIFSGLVVSFSRSAGLVFAVGFAGMFLTQKERRKDLAKIAFIFASVLAIWISAFSPLFFSRLEGQTRLEQKSLDDRQEYILQAKEIISENFWLGVGAGNYTAEIAQKNPEQSIWQIQPVHNVFLLTWAELGLVGLLLFLVALTLIFIKSCQSRSCLILTALYLLLIPDHWLWSSHFGLILIFLISGVIFKQIKD